MKKKLITSALPYVNNIPHLGNIIGSLLSADVFNRYCKLAGYETLFVCGTDEYGTATEIKAFEEKKTAKEICDHYHTLHKKIYDWFQIHFDIFGRTSSPIHTKITQNIFQACLQNGFIQSKSCEQYFDTKANLFLADRYLTGTCPFCSYENAYADQCDRCSKLLTADQLLEIKSKISGSTPVKKTSEHLYLDLAQLESKIAQWHQESSSHFSQTTNAITQSWLKEGLKERSITRDLTWGVPVPLQGFEKKVFYVWFDAPIGYISITASEKSDWKSWWQNPEVEWHLFMGKDNVPFHTIFFPATLFASKQPWVLPYHISATEYLNYENDKFSKSRGVGVFGLDAIESNIPADCWRYYLLAMRPEEQDTQFLWDDFFAKINHELLANFGNLFHRILSFVQLKLGGKSPSRGTYNSIDHEFLQYTQQKFTEYTEALENARLKEGLSITMEVAKRANKYFQDSAPWKTIKTDLQSAMNCLAILLTTLYQLGMMITPYLPTTAQAIFTQLAHIPSKTFCWDFVFPADILLPSPTPLFTLLDEKIKDTLKEKFSGKKFESFKK